MTGSMRHVFLCHAPSDAEVARDLAAWLELQTPYAVGRTECGPATDTDLVEAADQAMAAEAVILLLSPASVPVKWVRSRWEPVLIGQPADGGAALGCVLLAECKFPDLLRRRNFHTPDREGRRALKRWLLSRAPHVAALPKTAVEAPAAEVLDELRRRLADDVGAAAGAPWELALAFARECAADFEGVVWIDGARRSAAGVAGDLAHALGAPLSGPPEESHERLREFCAGRRLLIVFDGCAPLFGASGKCSVVATAPHPAREARSFEKLAHVFTYWTSSPEPCLAALGDLVPAIAERPWAEARSLAYSAVALLRHFGRDAELIELTDFLVPLAEQAGDASALRCFDWERTWIHESWGRVEPVAAPLLAPPEGDQLTLPFPLGE
jgi:hypothetical protein